MTSLRVGTIPRVFNLEITPDFGGPINLVVLYLEALAPDQTGRRLRAALFDGKYEQQMIVINTKRNIARGDLISIPSWKMVGWEHGKHMLG